MQGLNDFTAAPRPYKESLLPAAALVDFAGEARRMGIVDWRYRYYMSRAHRAMRWLSKVPGNEPAPFGNEFGVYGVSLLKGN